jgi:hypothetical protein
MIKRRPQLMNNLADNNCPACRFLLNAARRFRIAVIVRMNGSLLKSLIEASKSPTCSLARSIFAMIGTMRDLAAISGSLIRVGDTLQRKVEDNRSVFRGRSHSDGTTEPRDYSKLGSDLYRRWSEARWKREILRCAQDDSKSGRLTCHSERKLL